MVSQISQCCFKWRTVLHVLFSVYFRKGVLKVTFALHCFCFSLVWYFNCKYLFFYQQHFILLESARSIKSYDLLNIRLHFVRFRVLFIARHLKWDNKWFHKFRNAVSNGGRSCMYCFQFISEKEY